MPERAGCANALEIVALGALHVPPVSHFSSLGAPSAAGIGATARGSRVASAA